jgi:hypothetical protein
MALKGIETIVSVYFMFTVKAQVQKIARSERADGGYA